MYKSLIVYVSKYPTFSSDMEKQLDSELKKYMNANPKASLVNTTCVPDEDGDLRYTFIFEVPDELPWEVDASTVQVRNNYAAEY